MAWNAPSNAGEIAPRNWSSAATQEGCHDPRGAPVLPRAPAGQRWLADGGIDDAAYGRLPSIHGDAEEEEEAWAEARAKP